MRESDEPDVNLYGGGRKGVKWYVSVIKQIHLVGERFILKIHQNATSYYTAC